MGGGETKRDGGGGGCEVYGRLYIGCSSSREVAGGHELREEIECVECVGTCMSTIQAEKRYGKWDMVNVGTTTLQSNQGGSEVEQLLSSETIGRL